MSKPVKRPDGRWHTTLMVDGKRKFFYGKTAREARAKLEQAKLRLHQGLQATDAKQPLRTLLEDWYAAHAQTIKDTSAASYRTILDIHLLPALGNIPLKDVSAQRIQRYVNRLTQDEELAPRRVGQIHAVLSMALDLAVEWGLLAFNPAGRVKLPRAEKAAYVALDKEQARHLLATVADQWIGNLLTLALATGMRKGELQVLKWSDIDWKKEEVHVQRTLARAGKYGGTKEGTPKSETSDRVISLPAFAIDALKAQRRYVNELRLAAGKRWQDEGYVFPSSTGHWLTSQIETAWKDALEQAGLPDMRFHDLRHSAATLLLAMGIPVNVVQQILGHSRASITSDIYGHTLPGQQTEAMKKYDEQLG